MEQGREKGYRKNIGNRFCGLISGARDEVKNKRKIKRLYSSDKIE